MTLSVNHSPGGLCFLSFMRDTPGKVLENVPHALFISGLGGIR